MTPTERDRIRRILLDALPADARWVVWVEGVLDRIEQGAGVALTSEEAQMAAWALRAAKGWPRSVEGDWDATLAHSHAQQALAARLEEETS